MSGWIQFLEMVPKTSQMTLLGVNTTQNRIVKQSKDKRKPQMKHVSIALLIVTVSMASCAEMQQKETVEESGTPSFQPKPLDDEYMQ